MKIDDKKWKFVCEQIGVLYYFRFESIDPIAIECDEQFFWLKKKNPWPEYLLPVTCGETVNSKLHKMTIFNVHFNCCSIIHVIFCLALILLVS